MGRIKNRIQRIFRRSSTGGQYQGPVQPNINEATFRQTGQSIPNNAYQGPVPQGANEKTFRESGKTVTSSGQPYKVIPRRSGGGGGGSPVTINQPSPTPSSITPVQSVATTSGIQPPSIVDRVKQAYRNYNNPNNPTSTALNPFFSGSQVTAYQKPLSTSGTPAGNVYNFQQQQRSTRTDLSPDYKPVTLGQAYEQARVNTVLPEQGVVKEEINKAQERIDQRVKARGDQLQQRINEGKITVQEAEKQYTNFAQKVVADENKSLGTNKAIVTARERRAFNEGFLYNQYGGAKLSTTPSSTKASEGLYNYFTSGTGLPLDAALIAIPAARAAKLEADIVETNIILRGGNKAVAKGLGIDTALVGAVKAPKIKQQFAVATVKEAPYFKQTTAYTVDVYKKKKGVSPSLVKDLRIETEYFDVGKNKYVTRIDTPKAASVFTKKGGTTPLSLGADNFFKVQTSKQVPFYKSEGFLYKEGTTKKIQPFSSDSFVKMVDKGKIADLYQIKTGKYTDGFTEQARIYALSAKRTRATSTAKDGYTLFSLKQQRVKPAFPLVQVEAEALKTEGSAFKEVSKVSTATQTKQQTTVKDVQTLQGKTIGFTTQEQTFNQLEKNIQKNKPLVLVKTATATMSRYRQPQGFITPQIQPQVERTFNRQALTPRFQFPKFRPPTTPFKSGFDYGGTFGGFTGVPPVIPIKLGGEFTKKEYNPFKTKKQNKYYPDYAAAFLGITKRVSPKEAKRAANRIYTGVNPKPVLLFRKKKKRSEFDLFR